MDDFSVASTVRTDWVSWRGRGATVDRGAMMYFLCTGTTPRKLLRLLDCKARVSEEGSQVVKGCLA